MKVAVCDDEKVSRREIVTMLDAYRRERRVDIFPDIYDSGSKLLAASVDYDIIFMDYQMADIDGIETSRRLREAHKKSTIIFISAYPQAALDCFEVDTFRFITKPIDKTKLYKALDDHAALSARDDLLILNTHEGIWKINMSEIIYAEANGKHTIIRTVDRTYDVHTHLKVIEAKLPKTDFIRSHRGYVVGFAHIRNHNCDEILFDNGEKAYIGKHYLTAFKTGFQDYVLRYNKGTGI